MKEAVWGVLIVALGLLGIVIVQTFQNVTTTNDQTYYLLKESTEAAMLDSVDLTYYRKTGVIRIVEDKFVENLTRRFAESANSNQDYDIVVHEVIETPPFVSVSIGTYVFSLKGDSFNIQNSVDSIIETKYSKEKYKDLIDESLQLTCITSECEINACINGDLRFTGWEDLDLPDAVCQQGAPSENLDRDANYQVCDNGIWKDKKEEVKVEEPEVREDCITYTWNFKKESELHDIDVTTKEVVEYENCVESFTICPPGGITIYVGESSRLTPSFTPDNVVNKDLSWTSSNTSVLVQGNTEAIVTGYSVGNAVITARSSNNKTATCDVKVVELGCPSQPITMDPNSTVQATLENGVIPSNAVWRTGNDNYATIDSNGKITSKDMYGTYWYYVDFNNTTVECPFFIKNPQQKDLIVTCDKNKMNVYEDATCTVKSSELGETLTDVALSCTNNSTKLTPKSSSNNTIVCSPDEAGELNVKAVKSGYVEGNTKINVSVIGEETFGVTCVKSSDDTTPISTGINFNTYIKCSVNDNKKADLKFEYKSYSGSSISSKDEKDKFSIDYTTGSTKGILILTATSKDKNIEPIIKYFEVGCVPGTIYSKFDITEERKNFPVLCPQHLELRKESIDTDAKPYQLFTTIVPDPIYNNRMLCGAYGYTDPTQKKQYSIEGSSDDLAEKKYYRSYYDLTVPLVFRPSLTTPNVDKPTVGKYSYHMLYSFNYNNIDIDNDSVLDDPDDILWASNVHDYLSTSYESRSNTIGGKYLKATDSYCVEFAAQHPLSDEAINPIVTLTPRTGKYYLVPEQPEAKQYFIDISFNYPQYFANTGKWDTTDKDILIVREYQYDSTYGRAETMGKSGKVTVTYTADLNELGQQLFKKKTVSAQLTLTALKNCGDLSLNYYGTTKANGESSGEVNLGRGPILNTPYIIGRIELSDTSDGNAGKWQFIANKYNDYYDGEYDLLNEETFLSSSKVIRMRYLFNNIKTGEKRTIQYQRTVDKCTITIDIDIPYDIKPPTMIVKYDGVEKDQIYIKKYDVYDKSKFSVEVSDDYSKRENIRVTSSGHNTVDTSIVNTYKLNYSAVDEMNNRTAIKTIQINVVDELPAQPTCGVISSNSNWTNTNVDLTGSVSPESATVKYTYQWYKDGNLISGANTSSYQADSSGNYTFKAIVNNSPIEVNCEATTEVKIDKIKPTCTANSTYIDNGTSYNGSWTNRNIKVTAACSDSGGSTCNGIYITNEYSDNLVDTVAYLGYVSDKAGNQSSDPCAGLIVKIDKIAPKCASSGGSSSWTNSAITLTGTCTDTGSDCTKDVTKSFVTTNELYNQSPGTVYDEVGNSITCPENQTVKIDTTTPSVSISGDKDDGAWTNGDVSLTGNINPSTTKSGYTYQWYRNGSIISGENSEYYTATSSGTYTLRATTGAGTYDEDSYDVNIDKVAPKCSVSSSNSDWTRSDVTITGTCSDEGGSGCQGNISHVHSTEGITYNVGPNNGSSGYVYDKAGNQSKNPCLANQIVKIDKTAPRCVTVGGSEYWQTTDVLITGYCYDDKANQNSGCTGDISKEYSLNGFESTTAGPGSTAEGRKVYDKAGNYTICSADQTVRIDKTAPTCTTTGGGSWWTNQDVTITGICSDTKETANSGCKGNISYTYKVASGSAVDKSNIGPGTNGKGGEVYDKAGHAAFCDANQTVKIDKKAPTCPSSGTKSYYKNGSGYCYISISNADSDSGVNSTMGFLNCNLSGASCTISISDKAGNSSTCRYSSSCSLISSN